jgi:hypothetical protein
MHKTVVVARRFVLQVIPVVMVNAVRGQLAHAVTRKTLNNRINNLSIASLL